VTKVMSLLLVMEAIEEGRLAFDEMVSVSPYAASMGGSQVYLEAGERMSVHELLKAVAVSSANDATVALAEHISGSTEAFVAAMNRRAAELGMKNTQFINATGLDADGHVTSARDIALMSRELVKHEKIFEYTTIWMDTIRGGEFGLSNTNKLVRFYDGANGLKTGSTSIARYCLSATALRGSMQIIAVVMAAPTSDDRFADAKRLLDYGFAAYAVHRPQVRTFDPIKVAGGVEREVAVSYEPATMLVAKGKERVVEERVELADKLTAPVERGQKVGTVKYFLDGEEIHSADILTVTAVGRIGLWGLFAGMLAKYLMLR